MATPAVNPEDRAYPVTALETELSVLIQDVERMQEEHPDDQFPDDVVAKWDWTNRKIEETKKQLELARRQERLRELKRSNPASQEGPGFGIPAFQVGRTAWREDPYDLSSIERSFNPEDEALQFRDRARHIIERDLRFRHPHVDQDEAKHRVTTMVEEIDTNDGRLSRHMVVNSSPLYKRAIGKYIEGAMLTGQEGEVLNLSRALSLTSAAGGYAVPVELDPTIMPTSNLAISPFRAISNVKQITVDTFNGVTAGAITAAYGAEATPTTDSSPTLGQVVISTERASAFIPFSIEIGQDWGSLQTEMARLLQDAKDTLEATKFSLGSGTNEPYGLITGATTVYTGSSATGITVLDLEGVDAALPPRFRANASWMFGRPVANKLRNFDQATAAGSGSAIWIDNLRQGVSSNAGIPTPGRYSATVLGYPAYENTAMSSTFTTGQLVAVLGDFSYFIIVDRIGMNIETIPHLFDVTFNQPTGQRGLYCYWRNGAKVADAAAFRTLKLG